MSTKLIRRFLLASTLVLGGAIALTPAARADNFTISGTQNDSCNFGTQSSGADTLNFTATTVNTPAAVTVPLTCTGASATMSGTVERTLAPAATATSSPTLALTLGGSAFTSGGAFGTAGTKTVGMAVSDTMTSPNVFPSGDYTYTVTLTATP
jgi:hypothetical protein